MTVRIAPSILSADFARLGADVREAEEAGVDWIHIDVMDGAFVPNISIGPGVTAAVNRVTDLFLDVHLMVDEPVRYLAEFTRAGADLITVHAEACTHLHRTLQAIDDLGCRAGVALNPATPVQAIEEVADLLHLVLVMSVNPGFGGQRYIPASTDKIRRVRRLLDDRGRSETLIEVDGGVTEHNVREITTAGADVVVAGSAIFNDRASVAANVGRLRNGASKDE